LSWIRKYKPLTHDELLLPYNKQVRTLVKVLFETDDFPFYGLILHGVGGTGKTTFIETLIRHKGWGLTELKDSGESKHYLEVLDNRLANSTLFGKQLVFCNEVSKCSKDFREGLRGIIDRHNENTFFIFSDNNYDKLKSENPQLFDNERIKAIHWDNLSKGEFRDKCLAILKAEGLLNSKNEAEMDKQVGLKFPSIRSVIQNLETNLIGEKYNG
jgi:predicted AAA+ superfamily ATPase